MRGEESSGVLFQVDVKAATVKALLLRFRDGGEEWVPRSQILPGGELPASIGKGAAGTIMIAEWLANEKLLSHLAATKVA